MYQNEYLLPARIGRDGKPFTDYVNALRNAAQEHLKTLPKGDGRAMMLTICIKPDRRARFWFTFRSEPLTDPATDALREILTGVPPGDKGW